MEPLLEDCLAEDLVISSGVPQGRGVVSLPLGFLPTPDAPQSSWVIPSTPLPPSPHFSLFT